MRILRIPEIELFANSPLEDARWQHGEKFVPTSWPWWVRFRLNVVKLQPKTGTGRRLWVYTRKKAYDFDLYLDAHLNE